MRRSATVAVAASLAVVLGACTTPLGGTRPQAQQARPSPIPSDLPTPPYERVDGAPIARHKIAFTKEGVLYESNGDGSDRRVITRFPGPPFPYGGASWSPDGQSLIIRTETKPKFGRNGYIYKVNAEGPGLTNLSRRSGSHYDAMAAWSPDGKRIAYTATKPKDQVSSLYLMNSDGSEARRLLHPGFEIQYPAWSSQDRIAFTGVVGFEFDIYSVASDGSDMIQLTDDSGDDNWPSFSPDGSRIVFFSNRDGTDRIWVMNADGSDQRKIAEGGEPNWSPHGGYITFNCGDAERAVVCAVRPDATKPIELFEDAGFPVIRPEAGKPSS